MSRVKEVVSLLEEKRKLELKKSQKQKQNEQLRKQIQKRKKQIKKKPKKVSNFNAYYDVDDDEYDIKIPELRPGTYLLTLHYKDESYNLHQLEGLLLPGPKIEPVNKSDITEDYIKNIIDEVQYIIEYDNKAEYNSDEIDASNTLINDGDFAIEFDRIPTVKNDTNPPEMKDNININCVVEQFMTQKTNLTKIQKEYLENISKDNFENGVSVDILKQMCKKLDVFCEISDVFGKLWFEYKYKKGKRQTIKFISHNKHAQQFTISDLYGKNQEVKYINNIEEEYKKINELKIPIKNSKDELTGFITKNIIYKDYIKMFPDEESYYYWTEKINYNEKRYKLCFGETSFWFKDFIENNNLQKEYLNQNIMEICKSANYWSIAYNRKIQTDDTQVYGYDMCNAYATAYKQTNLYKHYLFPNDMRHLYNTNDLKALDLTGFCLISKVEDLPDYVKYHCPIEPNKWYSCPLLKKLFELGVKFEIESVLYSTNPVNLTIPVPKSGNGKILKYIPCSISGKLCQDREVNITNIDFNNKEEFDHFCYLYSNQIIGVDKNNLKIAIEMKNNRLVGYYHIHAYILDYLKIVMLDKLAQIDFSKVVKIKVDSIYTTYNYDDLFKLNWKKENKYKYFDWMDPENRDLYQHKKYAEWNKPETELFNNFPTQNMLFIGPGGAGKTYYLDQQNYYNSVKCFPTNQMIETLGNGKGYTYYKMFDILTPYNRELYKNYSVISVDENSMVCYEANLKMLELCKKRGIILILMGDDKQLQPVPDAKTKKYDLNIYKMPELMKQFKIIDFNILYRQKDDELKKLVSDVRNGNKRLPNNVKIVKWNEVNDFRTNDIFIAYRNEDVNDWANSFDKPEEINASTVHKYQGTTIDKPNNVYILLNNINDQEELLYTAITRVRYFDQLIFVKK